MTAPLGEVIQKRISELFDVDPQDPDVQEVAWVVQKIARDLREGRIEPEDVDSFMASQRTALRGLARRCSTRDPDEVVSALRELIEEVASLGLHGTLGRVYELYKAGRRQSRRREEARGGLL